MYPLISEKHQLYQNEPYFETSHSPNITALENESVILKCAVKNKGNKTVSCALKHYVGRLRFTKDFFSCKKNFIFSPKSFENRALVTIIKSF